MNRHDNPHRVRSSALLAVLALVAGGCGAEEQSLEEQAQPVPPRSITQAIDGAMPFGTMCQQEFQDDWRNSLPGTWTRCGGFNGRFDDVATHRFYYNLVGAEPVWETTYSPWYLDSVSLFFAATHGGAWSDTAAFSMWDRDAHAMTKNMRLGNTLSILSTYSCETLKPDDRMVTRWLGVMAGGLHIVTGSHGTLYASWLTDDIGEDYADNLAHQWSVKDAWVDGLWDTFTPQQVAVMSVGRTVADCAARRDGISVYNYIYQERLRDGAIAYMCWSTWDE